MRGEIVPGALVPLLTGICLDRRTGALELEREGEHVRLFFREGRVLDVDSRAQQRPAPRPEDPASMRLHAIVKGLGIRRRRPGPPPGRQERLLAALSWTDGSYSFEEGAIPPAAGPGIALSTGQLIAEAVRRIEASPTTQAAPDDEQRIPVPPAEAVGTPEPLTPAEDELVGRADGSVSTGDVLAAASPAPERAEAGGAVDEPPPSPAAAAPAATAVPADEDAERPHDSDAPLPEPEGLAELRREIQIAVLDLHRKSHFELLGVSEEASPAGIDEAYRRLRRRLDEPACAHPSLDDLRADIEALRLRIEGAYRALSEPASRAAYEEELARRTQQAFLADRQGPSLAPNTQELALQIEERIYEADRLLARERCGDAAQILEELLVLVSRGRRRRRVQILLARACLANPKGARRAEELLQEVVREDPANVDGYLALGALYKTRGLSSRAATMFRKVLELKPGHQAAALELHSGPLQKLLGRH